MVTTYTNADKAARQQFMSEGIEIKPGETVHVNHNDCPAGEDTRERLYYTRCHKPTHMVMYYCHNCGTGGSFHTGKRATFAIDFKKPEPKNELKKHTPAWMKCIWDEGLDLFERKVRNTQVPTVVVDWLFTGRPAADAFFPPDTIKYHPMHECLLFGAWPEGRYPSGPPDIIQQRFFRNGGPKCLTHKAFSKDKARNYVAGATPKWCVIVEDMLSQYRVLDAVTKDKRMNEMQAAAYCLMGNTCTIEELLWLKQQGIEHLYVWLDNDNEIVLRNAELIARRAATLGMKSNLITHYTDPKYYGYRELIEYLAETPL
jgi:translation initiation factor 2 beta subunit (eIF-2beta)/eIF-5